MEKKIKRVKTVSETILFDNSGDADARLHLSARVKIREGVVSAVENGTIDFPGEGENAQIGRFGQMNASSMDLNLYRTVEGMTRGQIMDMVESFIAAASEAAQ
ncbi:MAG: hypothetical protein NC248_11395 [Bacteroides sp.]|nr:hypothetical protein [Bacteroides sp.]MCM1391043.1 hypothetical protein [Bacteroides sp.]